MMTYSMQGLGALISGIEDDVSFGGTASSSGFHFLDPSLLSRIISLKNADKCG